MIDSDTPDEVVIQLYRCLLGSLLEVRGCHPAVPLSPWLAARGNSDTPDEVVIQLYRCLLGSLLEVIRGAVFIQHHVVVESLEVLTAFSLSPSARPCPPSPLLPV